MPQTSQENLSLNFQLTHLTVSSTILNSFTVRVWLSFVCFKVSMNILHNILVQV